MPSFDAHALVIGISAYREVTPLSPKPDAEDMAVVLADPQLCAYPPGNVRLLLQGEATRARILEELTALARRTTEDSTVFVYFSGHGGIASIRGADVCFLMAVDSKSGSVENLDTTAISGALLSEHLRAIPAAKLTVVLDCCHAAGVAEPRDGSSPGGAALSGLSPDAVGLLARGNGRAVLAASRQNNSAFAMPDSRNGLFTGHLLAGLRGQAPGHGGVIRVCDLFHYVQQQTRAEWAEQRPVFKADIQENFPVALYRGGAAPRLELPAAPDAFTYDAFLSYSLRDRSDADWVRHVAAPTLEQLGLRLCLEERDFRLGARRLQEMERAVKSSRYTVCVFPPAYLEGPFEDFQSQLAQFQAVEGKSRRFLPLLRRPCRPELSVGMIEWLDVSDDRHVAAALLRLAVALRQPPVD
jgi:hypothetical protein